MDTLLIIDDEKSLLDVLSLMFKRKAMRLRQPPREPRALIF